ncbi:MAG: bifunctional phosphopantothenoylcysteine decarboxylase/phosphopantothenate--cysteine ligase CoaBC, partial [Nitrososphaerales archaeon]
HGAEVIPVLTPKAAQFVSPMIFEWSTGNSPITKLTGKVEHVELASSERVDLVLIAPCTANTLAKIASGIADEAVSTLVCTAIGAGIPILIASAMHEPMHNNPIIRQARERLEQAKVKFIEGTLVESKSKMAAPEEILRAVISLIGEDGSKTVGGETKDLAEVSFMITAGATREPIDSVRYITNASSGKMGVALAEQALSRGAKKICLIHGVSVTIPDAFKSEGRMLLESARTTQEMLGSVLSNLSKQGYDILISSAAPADYAPASPVKGKISTSDRQALKLRLVPTEKIIAVAKEKFPMTFIVAFKAEYDLGDKDLIRRASDVIKSSGADLVVANNVGRDDIGFGSDFNEVLIVDRKGDVRHLPKASKNEIANEIINVVLANLPS